MGVDERCGQGGGKGGAEEVAAVGHNVVAANQMRAPQVNLSLHSDYHREVAARAAQNAPSNVVVRPENLLIAAQKIRRNAQALESQESTAYHG